MCGVLWTHQQRIGTVASVRLSAAVACCPLHSPSDQRNIQPHSSCTAHRASPKCPASSVCATVPSSALLLPLLLLLLLLLLLRAMLWAGIWTPTDESEGGSELASELGIYKLPTLMFCGKEDDPRLLQACCCFVSAQLHVGSAVVMYAALCCGGQDCVASALAEAA